MEPVIARACSTERARTAAAMIYVRNFWPRPAVRPGFSGPVPQTQTGTERDDGRAVCGFIRFIISSSLSKKIREETGIRGRSNAPQHYRISITNSNKHKDNEYKGRAAQKSRPSASHDNKNLNMVRRVVALPCAHLRLTDLSVHEMSSTVFIFPP